MFLCQEKKVVKRKSLLKKNETNVSLMITSFNVKKKTKRKTLSDSIQDLRKCPNWKMHESKSACFPIGVLCKVQNRILKHFSHKVLYNYYSTGCLFLTGAPLKIKSSKKNRVPNWNPLKITSSEKNRVPNSFLEGAGGHF